MSILEILQVVEVVEATIETAAIKRVPEHLKQYTFFGDLDQWQYYAVGDKKLCDYCSQHDGTVFSGSEIRGIFPELEIKSENMIYPRVHMDLWKRGIFGEWSKDSCRCVLIRLIGETPLSRELKFFDALKEGKKQR